MSDSPVCHTTEREVSATHYPIRVTLTFSCGNAYSGFGSSEMEASLYAHRKHPHATGPSPEETKNV